MSAGVIGIIPARGGSKGVKRKNIRLICGHPLIAYSIAVAKISTVMDEVIISTDDDEIKQIAEFYGANVPFLRPQEISQDTSTDLEFMLHAMEWMKKQLKPFEYWVHLRPTTPVRETAIVDKAINQFMSNSSATALRSGHMCGESPFKWFRINDDGYFQLLCSDETNLEVANRPRQQFPAVYVPDGYVDVVRSSFVLNQNQLHGDKVVGFESPRCHEIDTLEDVEYIEYQLQKNGSELLDYLNTHFKKK